MARNTTPSDPGSDSSLPVTTPRRGEFPDVGRPRGHALRSLESEGITFESQVLIVGGESDLAARLMLTSKRLVLAAGGEIAIEIPRAWLRPQPRLVAENGIRIFVTPEGAEAGGDDTDRISLRARDGRGAALQLIAALNGRPIPDAQPEAGSTQTGAPSSAATTTAPTTPSIAAEVPTWSSAVGASPTVGLPPLPDFLNTPSAATANAQRPSWPPIEKQGISSPPGRAIPTRTQSGADSSYRQSPATGPTDVTFRGRTNDSITGWTSRHLDATPAPAAVPSTVSRAARKQGTLADGVTIADTAIVPSVLAEESRPGLGYRSLVWGLRLAIILVLLGTGAYLGRDYLRQQAVDLNVPLPARVESQLGIDSKREQIAQVVPTSPGETGNQLEASTVATEPVATLPETRGDNTRDDLGGTTGPLPTTTSVPTEVPAVAVVPTDVPTEEPVVVPTDVPVEQPTDIPTDVPVVIPTDVPADQPTDIPVVVPTEVPTEIPTLEPTQVPTEVPTEVPTLEPTTEPTQAPTLEPTTEPTQAPTEKPTLEPTTAPTQAPTTEPTEAPTQAPTQQSTAEPTVQSTATVAMTPTLVPQAPSVDPSVTPDQQIATTNFRFSVAGAEMGESIPDLPQINTVNYGEWLVLSVSGENMSSKAQVFNMNDFKLIADGVEVQVDVGNGWVAGMLGYTPAYGNTDSILWAPGESHQFALTFLAPVDAKSLELKVGNQTMDLTSALASDKPLVSTSPKQDGATLPKYIEAKVLKVVNAETIVVEVDGVQQQVRYLGLDAPVGDDCFAADATKANAALVEGKTVRIERQATNVDAKGNWVRDVWAPNSEGTYELVSAMLVSQGAARSGVTQPNTRFSGWLMGSESAAKAQGIGLWKSCGENTPAASTGGNQTPSTNATSNAAIMPDIRNGIPS